MFKRIISSAGLMSILLVISNNGYAVDRIDIDSFEYSNFPIVRPSKLESAYTYYLWGHDPSNNAGDQRPGRAKVETNQSFIGSSSMRSEVDSALNTFIQFYPYDDAKYQFRFMREQIQLLSGQNNWKLDTYNRLRFWVKIDPNQTVPADQQTNFHFGTYYRATNGKRKSAEDGGDHAYHYYNIEPTGEWHQIIVDFHPSHQRGDKGNKEQGVIEYPTGEPGYNYFDLMTRFYVKFVTDLSSYPGEHYFDGFELYQETNSENVKQVYSLSGVYSPKSNKIIVAWKRDKNQDNLVHEVRYSYNSIHTIGWDNAKTLPNSNVTPKGTGGYNGMKFKTTTDKLEAFANQPSVFIGIRPIGATLFREIEIPIGSIVRPKKIDTLRIQ